MSFEVRGLIEGFYGPPWSHEARTRVVSFLAPRGMNAFVYAPKSDPYHRDRWRDPYPPERHVELVDLHGHCRDRGVRFAFALSPGLDFDGASADDRAALWAKIEPLAGAGVDWFVLGFDDVPLAGGAGRVHGELVARLRERLPDARLSVVPTDYVGTRPSPYLDQLATALPPETDVFWTGSTVVPATITAAEATERVEATGNLPLLVWDNYPVNDAFMDASLHLGPLRGRDPGLGDVATGFLANPMTQPHASLIPLATVADYLSDPHGYDAEASWERSIGDVAAEFDVDVAALRTLATACSASALAPAGDDPVHALVSACEAGDAGAEPALAQLLDRASRLPGAFPDPLASEVAAWAEQAAAEAAAGTAALGVLGSGPDGSGPDGSWSGVLGVMGMLVLWTAARRASDRVAFGPRFACYPAIVQDGAGGVAVDPVAALVEDRNAVDRLCRFALARAGAAP